MEHGVALLVEQVDDLQALPQLELVEEGLELVEVEGHDRVVYQSCVLLISCRGITAEGLVHSVSADLKFFKEEQLTFFLPLP